MHRCVLGSPNQIRTCLVHRKPINLLKEDFTEKLNDVQRIFLTPSLFRMHKWANTKISVLMFGGEESPSYGEITANINREASFWNLYGLTECSVWSSCTEIHKHEDRVPIFRSTGDLAPGHTFSVKSETLQITVTQPCTINGMEVSKVAADIVEVDKNGKIYFSSRLNNSIKRNGYTVSLSSIRSQLLCHPVVEG